MARLVGRRLAFGLLIVWLVSVIVFLATQLLPGDAAQELLGRYATPQSVAALRIQMHLNEAPLYQYLLWLKNLVTFQWGHSLVSQNSIASIVGTGAGAGRSTVRASPSATSARCVVVPSSTSVITSLRRAPA